MNCKPVVDAHANQKENKILIGHSGHSLAGHFCHLLHAFLVRRILVYSKLYLRPPYT